MSALTSERDWMRTCANDRARPPAERRLWAQLADEIDAYLTTDHADTGTREEEPLEEPLWT